MKVKYIRVSDIVKSVSDTHSFDFDELYAVNTSDVEKGNMLKAPLINTDELKGQFKKSIQKNDILFSEIRPANEHYAIVRIEDTEQYVASTKLMVLRKYNADVDLMYFYYWLTNKNMLNILQSRAENRICSFPQITFELLSEYLVPVPLLDIQKKISKILSNIDDKIENNNKINAELESMAKTIYDYWFLQFEFPNEEGKPYKSSGGKMIWNEELKHEIPKGWECKTIKDIENDIITGKTPSSKVPEYYNGDIPFITIGDIRGNMYVVTTEQTLSEEGAKTQNNKFIPEGSICVTCIATPGLVGFSVKDSQTNQQINSIVPKNKKNSNYLYFAINEYFEYASGAKTGNTFANMNKEDFSNILLLYNKEMVEKYFDITKDIFDKIKQSLLENEELASLRDFLLPMLMNGQIGFKDGER